MNDRIRELAEQAGLNLELQSLKVEKFAELIVRECCDVLYDNEMGGYQVNYVLKEHFGVEKWTIK